MARVTAGEVNALGGWTATELEMAPFIELASSLVSEEQAIPASLLKQMEKLLAAHLFEIREPPIQSDGGGGIAVTYARGSLGQGLSASRWGQEYNRLLRRARKRSHFSVKVL